MIPVYIPSAGRADARVERGPAVQLPGDTPIFYVVPRDQYIGYMRELLLLKRPNIRVLACPEQPHIGRVRQWIGQHAQNLGYARFCTMDDDVNLLVRKGPDNWQLVRATEEDGRQMLEWMERQLAYRFANVGISAREGNNRAGVGDPDAVTWYDTRLMRVQAYMTDVFLRCAHGRVQVMEDFDVSLQILRMGHSNACCFYWAQGQRMTNEDGGCSTWRTHEVHEQSAMRLAAYHMGLVTLRAKENKTDADGFGTRTEVTVRWKEAARMGRQALAAASAGQS